MKNKPFVVLALALLCALDFRLFTSLAQDITATVAPNIGGSDNYVDIQNTNSGRWYFYSHPTPAAATMSRFSGLSEFPWPTSIGNFAPDPGNYVQDRIFQGEHLRVYPNTLGVGTLIQIAYATAPLGTQYHFNITVTSGSQVTALNILDASPTSAATVHWQVSFDHAVSGVTAANFVFNNPQSISGLAITSVTPNSAQPSTNWTVTVSTGTGTGILGLNWAGHQTESPGVPNTFTGQYYDFSVYPILSQYPASAGINAGSTATMSVVATSRDGVALNYQWYSGTSVNPTAATAIAGATNSSYTPAIFLSIGSYQYFCRVSTTPGYHTDSTTATITVVFPPFITSSPQNAFVLAGQTATLTVASQGTSLNYQWYQGLAPDTSNPVGGNWTSYITPPLNTNTSYWVQVANPGPTTRNSTTATAVVIASLTPSAAGYAGSVNLAFPTAFAVTTRDATSNLVANLPITFTAPGGSGASGHFPGNATLAGVNTGTNGVATAPVFTANAVVGKYNVSAAFSTLAINLAATNNTLVTNTPFMTTIANNQITITGYTGLPPSQLVIPAAINGLPVTSIAFQALAGFSFTSVSIPNSVTNIGTEAFDSCASLGSVTIPASVISIGDYAFTYCYSLTNATFNGNAPTMGLSVFFSTPADFKVYYYSDATGFTSPTWLDSSGDFYPAVNLGFSSPVYFTTTTSNNQVTITGYSGPTGPMIIPGVINGLPVTAIGDNAFAYDAQVTSITIPASITNIGAQAFVGGYALTSINVSPSNAFFVSVGGVLFNANQTTIIAYPVAKAGGSYITPNGVTSIADGAFSSCYLTNVTIPFGVTNIGNQAFNECALVSLTIPTSVTSLGSGAFEFCYGLTSVTIPASVTSIGNGAFYDCTRLTNAIFTGNAPMMAGFVFDSDPYIGSFTVYYTAGAAGFTSPAWKDSGGDIYSSIALAVLNTVTTTADSGPGSLRYAIANAATGATITFAANLSGGTIALTSGQLAVTSSVNLSGPGATQLFITGFTNSRVFRFAANTTNTISGVSLVNGFYNGAGASGGVILNFGTLALNACNLNGNSFLGGGNGGAIYNAGSLALTGCAVNNNSVAATGGPGTGDGGAIYSTASLSLTNCTLSGNNCCNGEDGFYYPGSGGAIFSSGTLTLTGCTLSGNYCYNGGDGALNPGSGGAIVNAGALTLIQCTLSGNTSSTSGGGSGSGGAIYNGSGPLTLTSCTLSANTSGTGGGIWGSSNLRNTLVAGNFSANGPDIFGTVTSQGHNLLGVADGSVGIGIGVISDLAGSAAAPLLPGLGSLGNYGGPTQTMPLFIGSSAVDAGDDALLNPPFNLATDQRGRPRKQGTHVDIGAFELLPGDFNYDGVVDVNELNTELNQVLGSYNNGAADQNVLAAVLARLNGNGTVNQAELNQVLSNYWPTSPWLYMTNVAGLGGTNVTFALTNSTAGAFNVQYSTDLVNWYLLGPATPRYLFTDTNAPAGPERFYRLQLP